MVKRKGMGKGRGKGYKNLAGRDPKVHSDSSKGRKQPQKIPHIPKEKPHLIVAKTILEQLGGNRFRAMTGAKNFSAGENNMSFSIPRAKNGINRITITLNSKDLYDVEFGKVGNFPKLDYKIIKTYDDVYNDQLQEFFTKETGLYTSL